jgi:hypothetical protein
MSNVTYYNFGSGWVSKTGESINFTVDPTRNVKQNKKTGVGYKMFLVPVDATGEQDIDNAVEITAFAIKENDLSKSPAGSNPPAYAAYAWTKED